VPLAVAVWSYDLHWKNTTWGPVSMAACRGLDVLLGAAPGRLLRAVPDALLVAGHTVTVTALSRHETTGATAALPRATLAATGAITATAGSLASSARQPAQALSTAFAGGYAAGYGRPQARAVANPDAGTIRRAVGAGITTLPMLQASLAARHGATLPALAVAVLGPLGRRLARWVSPT